MRLPALPARRTGPDFVAQGITDVGSFTRFYWNEQFKTAGLLIVLTVAGAAGGGLMAWPARNRGLTPRPRYPRDPSPVIGAARRHRDAGEPTQRERCRLRDTACVSAAVARPLHGRGPPRSIQLLANVRRYGDVRQFGTATGDALGVRFEGDADQMSWVEFESTEVADRVARLIASGAKPRVEVRFPPGSDTEGHAVSDTLTAEVWLLDGDDVIGHALNVQLPSIEDARELQIRTSRLARSWARSSSPPSAPRSRRPFTSAVPASTTGFGLSRLPSRPEPGPRRLRGLRWLPGRSERRDPRHRRALRIARRLPGGSERRGRLRIRVARRLPGGPERGCGCRTLRVARGLSGRSERAVASGPSRMQATRPLRARLSMPNRTPATRRLRAPRSPPDPSRTPATRRLPARPRRPSPTRATPSPRARRPAQTSPPTPATRPLPARPSPKSVPRRRRARR